MPAGRPPKPIELKERRGNPGKRPLPKPVEVLPSTFEAPDQDPKVPPIPITLDAPGRRYWAVVWNAGPWLNSRLDPVAVERVCHLVDEIAAYEREIASYGLFTDAPIVTPLGEVVGMKRVPNPATKELRAAEKQLASWLAVLGFDPAARSRLGLAEVKTKSKLEELIERRAQRSQG